MFRPIARLQHGVGSRSFSATRLREKQRLVILGSGWGGYEVLRGVDKKRWDVVLVSPNNYFNFTPLLAGCAVGTLEFRCAIEPVKSKSIALTNGIYQAWCDRIDFQNKVLQCMPATKPPLVASSTDYQTSEPGNGPTFPLKYDKLVIAVGAYSQTFNVPAIRSRIFRVPGFEQANQPTLSDTERRQLLNFCVVGAGPTGVEFAAELHDLLHAEIQEHYPSLAKMARINLYDGPSDHNLVQYAEKSFRREGISIWTSHHVDKVEAGKLHVKEQGEVPYGLLVWSTGLSPNPLIASINELKKYEKTQSILTDEHLNALRSDGSPDPDVFVIGDAGSIESAPLPATAQGYLAYIGNWWALSFIPEDGGIPGLSKEYDRPTFTQTLSIRNKILVPFYWFLNCKLAFDIRL
ncbi:FAD/NAD(P)-binding domain-containing protein [Gymnopus androsaceus JB14]|uniref:FAD/NAD(P)-binding domain-containing protein n=1 Tax=Gymnopus androsaceus JB14 TaxID=1447944 RepID=A0A6A4I9K9_9AGAR|nr:FAD/NAD(P)-binding domain-containing protein [Gymnopus androsaceus JB14]